MEIIDFLRTYRRWLVLLLFIMLLITSFTIAIIGLGILLFYVTRKKKKEPVIEDNSKQLRTKDDHLNALKEINESFVNYIDKYYYDPSYVIYPMPTENQITLKEQYESNVSDVLLNYIKSREKIEENDKKLLETENKKSFFRMICLTVLMSPLYITEKEKYSKLKDEYFVEIAKHIVNDNFEHLSDEIDINKEYQPGDPYLTKVREYIDDVIYAVFGNPTSLKKINMIFPNYRKKNGKMTRTDGDMIINFL